MLSAKNHKYLNRTAVWLHIKNENINVGWNAYLAPYISMLYYLSLMEIVIAKLFPDLFTSATSIAVASFIAFVWLSYLLGARHKRVETLRKRMRMRKAESEGILPPGVRGRQEEVRRMTTERLREAERKLRKLKSARHSSGKNE